MNSKKTLEKYIEYTFDKDLEVVYTSSITAEVKLKDGVVKLLALNDLIVLYIDDVEYQILELVGDVFVSRY